MQHLRRSNLPPSVVLRTTTTKNYGMKGGYLICSFWTFADGDPTGVTKSMVVPGL